MSLLLNVPFAQKDEVKKLGAKWNPLLKKWYVESQNDYHKFLKWILNGKDEALIICDHIYIVKGTRTCFKCHKNTNVIGFGIENRFEIIDSKVYGGDNPCTYENGEINIASYINPLPKLFYNYLEKTYNYHLSFSKTTSSSSYSNNCQHCNMLQGNFFLFEEVDSPFFIDCVETARSLTLYKIKLHYDFIAEVNLGFGSSDYLIKEQSKIIEIDNTFEL